MGLGQHQAMAILKRVNVHHAVTTLVLVQFKLWDLPGNYSAEDAIRLGHIVNISPILHTKKLLIWRRIAKD